MATQTFDLKVTCGTPRVDGGSVAPIPLAFAGSYESKQELELALTGSGSTPVQLVGARPMKMLLVWADPQDVPTSCQLRFDGSNDGIPLRSGGALAFFDPLPGGSGLDSLQVVHTTAMVVHVLALG